MATEAPLDDHEATTGAISIDEILRTRRVVFVTGKGGVGKSAVAASLALRARTLGKSPILFECDAPPRPSLFPGAVRTTSTLREVSPGIRAVNQPSEDAIRAYAAASLPSARLADLLLENRVSRLFLKSAPSVTEMALIGRIAQLAEEHGGPVIVDLHSTGHALHILRAPEGIMRVLRAGPVYERAKKVREFVFDADKCVLIPVALPEELPVTEMLEFVAALEELGVPLGPVFLNGVYEDPAPDVSDEVIDSLRRDTKIKRAVDDLRALRSWSRRAVRERARLRSGLDALGCTSPIIALPYVVEVPAGTTIAAILDDQLATLRAEAA